MDKLDQATQQILTFRDERDWAQYHTPRNLAAALSIEAAELQEALLWKSDQEVDALLSNPAAQSALAEEIADILIFALLFCHGAGISPIEAIEQKLAINSKKYPLDLAKGKATKYTGLQPKTPNVLPN